MFKALHIFLILTVLTIFSVVLVVQSEWFLRSVLIPEIESATDGDLSVSNAELQVFRGVSLSDVNFKDKLGHSVSLGNFGLTYDLLSLLSGELRIKKLLLSEATIVVAEGQASEKKAEPETEELYPELPLDLVVERALIQNLSVSGFLLKKLEVTDLTSKHGGKLSFRLFNDEQVEVSSDLHLKLVADRKSVNLILDAEVNNYENYSAAGEAVVKLTKDSAHLTLKELTGFFDKRKLLEVSGVAEFGQEMKFNGFLVKLFKGDEEVADAQFSGRYGSNNLTGKIVSSKISVDGVLETIPKSDEEDTKSEPPSETKESNFGADIELAIGELNYQNSELKELAAKVGYGDDKIKLEGVTGKINEGSLTGDLEARLKEVPYIWNGELEIKEMDLSPFDKEFSGRLKRLRVVAEEGKIDARAIFKKVEVPAYMQESPPFNLIFLPITALDYAIGQTAGALLPSAVTDIVKEAKAAVKEQGRIVFDHIQVRGDIDSEKLTLSDTEIDGDVLPTVVMKGDVGFDKSLDLVIGVEVLKVPVPLPVAGSLSTPLPKVTAFVPELVKSLGAGALNVGEMFTGKDEEKFFERDD